MQVKDAIINGVCRVLGKVYSPEFVGKLTGNADSADTATKLSTARTIQTNLASTSTASFDGSANVTPGVTGTLATKNGGTGQTSANAAANSFINALDTGSSTPQDADYYVSQYVGGGTTTTTYHRRPMTALWEYIKGKISSVLGLTASSYGGNADTATSATKATQDESGNNIKSSYASSISISDHTITLKNKNGSSLGTVTVPDNNTDTKVTQTVTTSNASYPLLLAPNGQTATTTTTSYFDSGVTLNPSTNTIAANISGSAASCTGNAATATKATQDSTGQQINTTYIKGLSASGKTVTYTKGDGSTGTVDVVPTPNDIGALPITDFTGENNDLNTLIQSGAHAGLYQTDGNTLNTPYKAGVTAAVAGLILSYANSGTYGVQYAFISGKEITFSRTMNNGVISSWTTGFLPLTGGTLSGRLSVQPGVNWSQIQFGDGSGVSNHKIHGYSDDDISEVILETNRDGTNDNRTTFTVRSNHDGTVPANVIRFINYVDGTGTAYNIYGEHNRSLLNSYFLPLSGGTVTGTLVLSKTTDASGTANNSPALIVGGAATAEHIEMDANEIQGKTDGTTVGGLNLNYDGGTVTINNASGTTNIRGPLKMGSSIYSDTALTDNLGTAAIPWNVVYSRQMLLYGAANSQAGGLSVDTPGTTSTQGEMLCILGNNIATNSNGNSRGRVRLYNVNTGYTDIVGTSSTTNRTITLPNATGTVALMSNLNRTNSVQTANTAYKTYMARGIAANTTAMKASSTSLTNGCIYLQYQ